MTSTPGTPSNVARPNVRDDGGILESDGFRERVWGPDLLDPSLW